MEDLPVNDRITIPARDLTWTASRASGPGGQNVNRTESKVDLRFDLPSCAALSAPVKERLRTIVGHGIDADGRVVIVCQVHRDQPQNLREAREKLAGLVRRALVVPKKRKATKPTRGSKERRLADKKRTGETKSMRGRVSHDD